MSSTNEIRKQQLIKAPPSRVWRALTDADEFGTFQRRYAAHATGNSLQDQPGRFAAHSLR